MRKLLAILLILFAVSSSKAEKECVDCYALHDSTMNVLDYLLQKPLPNRSFEKKKFGDRLFLTVQGGGDWIRTSDEIYGFDRHRTGYRFGLSVGDWVTPVHGWRIGGGMGRHDRNVDDKPFFGYLSADYLMNLTSLVAGDNPDRRFEVIAGLGTEVQALHRYGHKLWTAYGLNFSLQPRVYLNNSTFIFIEPRAGIFNDGLDQHKSWGHFDWNASVSLGLGYRLNAGRGYRVDNSLWISDTFRDNTFVGFTGGMNYTGASIRHFNDQIGSQGGAFLGKWLAPSSGIRLSLSAGYKREHSVARRQMFFADVDYLWNLNATMNGYDPDRKIELIPFAGLSVGYQTRNGHTLYPGVHAGVQGVWNVSPAVGLFIQPEVRAFKKDFQEFNQKRAALLSSVNLGLIYNFRGSEKHRAYREAFDYDDFLNSPRYFVDFGAGLLMRDNDWAPNFLVGLGFGKWFTPELAWRIHGEYTRLKKTGSVEYDHTGTVGADFMINLSAAANGFDDERFLNLDIFAGLRAGAAHYANNANHLIYGPEVGMRGRFRLTDRLDFLLEPAVSLMIMPEYRHTATKAEPRLLAGFSYSLGKSRKKDGIYEGELKTEAPATKRFVTFSIGPNLFSETILNRSNLSLSMDLSSGYTFNHISGVEAGLSYDFINSAYSKHLYVGYFHIDYRLNLSGISTGTYNRNFNFTAFGGPAVAWSNRCKGKVSPAVRFGLEARFRVTDRLDLTVSPNFSLWAPRLEPGYINNHHFSGTGTLPVGISYKF